MIYLTAAVIVVGTLCLLDLLLTIGVLRRLREHGERLDGLPSENATESLMAQAIKAVGDRVDDFTTTTVDGREVSRGRLAGRTLVGFFSTHCEPCRSSVTPFAELVAGRPGGWDEALAVVVGEDADAAEFVTGLGQGARVVVEREDPDSGPVVSAFAVMGYPVYCVVDDQGVVLATGLKPERLLVPVPA
jgi:Redoxin